jgi:hypothetical protein
LSLQQALFFKQQQGVLDGLRAHLQLPRQLVPARHPWDPATQLDLLAQVGRHLLGDGEKPGAWHDPQGV